MTRLTTEAAPSVYVLHPSIEHDPELDVHVNTTTSPKAEPSPSEEQFSAEKKPRTFLLRVLRNPLFLVVFTWVLMAFLLAFEISGK